MSRSSLHRHHLEVWDEGRRSAGPWWIAALLGACAGAPTHPAPDSPRATDSDLRARARASLEEGEVARARALLDELLLKTHLDRARGALAAGAPEEALDAIDQALGLAPQDLEVRLLKADASLALAQARLRAGGGSAGLIEGALTDALDSYRKVPDSAHALLGASRAARLLGRGDEALDLARRAQDLPVADASVLEALGLVPERLYAEEAWAAYAAARAADAEGAGALAAECEGALGELLGRTGSDAWTWRRLVELKEWESRPGEALDTARRGLKRLPGDAGLLDGLARLTRALEGSAAAVSALETYVDRHPEVPDARWQLAVARYYAALEGTKAEPPVRDLAAFERAEGDFRGLRSEAPEFAERALGYEVVCRLARGWCAFHAGDLERAEREFLSMNALFERGIEWSLRGELESGIEGLFQVADALASGDRRERAGEVFETLHELQPESADFANNAGFLLRESAVALEVEGKRLSRAAAGRLANADALTELRARAGIQGLVAGSPEESAAFARAADERFSHARALMERSWSSYRAAVELAPEDVRIGNDAALVLVYYLHHDLAWAEETLLHCVEIGGPQVESKKAALAAAAPEQRGPLESELALLTEAWGDAHQSLGVLEWIHRRDAAAASRWLEKAIAIGPARPAVKNSLLPQVRGELEPEEDDFWDLLNWARPCHP